MKKVHYQLLAKMMRPAALVLFALSLPIACSKKGDVTPQPSCKIASYTYQGSGNPSTAIWEYDANGQLKSTADGTDKTTYVYDANGYLTTQSDTDASGKATGSRTYEYSNGRLAKLTYKSATGTITETELYEYNGAGELIKETDQYVSGSTYTYTYAGGKQTGYTIRNSGGTESQPYTFDNGLVKRYVSGNYQTNYEYDTQGRRTRRESYFSGKLTDYTVYEYTDGTDIYRSLPSFKGVPSPDYNNTGNGLETKSTSYSVSSTNVTTKASETTTSYVKNNSGFPTEANAVARTYNATGGVSGTTAYKATIQYTGCQ